jgi:hypothetical protein
MTNRVVFGQRYDGTYGLIVSEPGVDVLSVLAEKDKLFDSDWSNGGVVHATGIIARGSTASFPTLPYTPVALMLLADATGNSSSAYQRTTQFDATGHGWNIRTKYIKEPYYEVTPSSVTLLDKTAWLTSASISARYIILRVPG